MTVPPPPGATPPPPPPPGPPPGMGMPPVPPPTSSGGNGTATAAMICGIAGFFTCGLAGIVGIILGFSGRKKAQQMGGEGSGMAMAGIVLGIISVVLTILSIGFFVLAAATADEAIDDANDDFRKSVKESIEKQEDAQARNGDVAKSSDYNITDEEVIVDDYGYVTYKAFIENTADFESDYTIEVQCEGDLGDSDTQDTVSYSLNEGDKDRIELFFYFDQDTTSATCEVAEVTYGYQ